MKNFIFLACVAFCFASCISGRKSRNSSVASSPPVHANMPSRTSSNDMTVDAPSPVRHPASVKRRSSLSHIAFSSQTEHCNPLQFKYAILMGEEVEEINDKRLYMFIDNWYGTPYQYGGSSRTGVDCSGFASMLMDSVFDVPIRRTCRDQYNDGKKIRKSELFPGDLVFFNTIGKISHVGVFLGNNKFVHASTSNGVMISDLDEAYFKKRYAGSARVR